MPRNTSGVYTLPSGNPVVPGTTIDAAWANDTMEDMANEITNSLSRTGAGGMLAPFRIADGLVTGPGLSYLNETNTGLYRSGAGSVWMSVLGVNTVQFSTVGLTIPFGKALTAQGNASVSGTFAVTGATTLASTLAVTGALSATGGVLGNVTAASGTSTFNNVTINGDLDMNAGSSGTITNLPNPTNPGDASNKAYVDAQVALRLALTGGTMTGAIAMSNNKVTGVATPTADQDAANKAYVDSVAQGIDAKASCAAATTGNVTLSGTQTIDGYALVAGQRVLVKDQSTASQNGIYVVAAGSWSRSADADTWDELVAAFTFVEHGTTNANNGYICTIPVIGTLGTTPVTWAQFSGAGQINAGTGMSKTGNTLNVNTASSARIVVGADDIDLATTGVAASTYKSVTVDAYGRVTAGTNPTTLAGYGISDAYTQAQTNTFLDAKLSLTGGTMSGALAMGTNKITGLGDPTNAQDAATKNYIDTIFGSTTTAAASAAAAASSASAASASASSASNSASAAAASATSAAASFDSFDDRYLGAKASDPTVDNDGNPLLTGALYWNSTVSEMRVYNGTAWVAAYLPAAGYLPITGGTLTGPTAISVNSSSNALSITQVGSGNALYIEDVAADATPFVVSSTGVLGIGTTTPDNVTSAGIALVSNSGFYPQLVQRNTTADGNASYVVLEKNRNGAVVQNGDVMGNLVFRGFDGANYLQGAFINAVVSAAPGTNDMPTDLIFGTTPDGASGPTERLRLRSTGAFGLGGANYGTSGQVLTSQGSGAAPIWSSASGSSQWTTSGSDIYYNTGKVGVGVTAPVAPLSVRGDSSFRNLDLIGVNSSILSDERSAIRAYNPAYSTVTGFLQWANSGMTLGGYPSQPMTFSPNAGSGWFEAMRITTGGSVGIGTTSPNSRLDVDANVGANTTVLSLTNSANWGWGIFLDFRTPLTNGGAVGLAGRISSLFESSNNYALAFNTTASGTNAERARITAAGNVCIGVTSAAPGAGNSSAAPAGDSRLVVAGWNLATGSNSTAYTSSQFPLLVSGNSNGNNDSASGCLIGTAYTSGAANQPDHIRCYVAGNFGTPDLRFRVAGNGNVTNLNNSYGSLSDARFKENVTDATPKLSGINQLRVVNFNLKDDPKKLKQLGLIAQEVEAVFPGLVETAADEEGTKSIKYSVLVPMLLKAMQEQQSLITALTARVAALESN